jgi:capsular exopolysaccharide synthesis family protein
MNKTKIPVLNDKFDHVIFFQILRKSYWVAIVFVILSVVSAFLYLRYTFPVYSALSVIQINENDRSTRVLNIESVYQSNDDISKIIELLRSKEFLKRAFSKLNLEVSYFIEGTFLGTELYNRSPFVIEWKADNISFYDHQFYISFDKQNRAIITTYNGNHEFNFTVAENIWTKVLGGSIKYNVVDFNAINEQTSNRFYFVINNPENIVSKHISNLQITLLNRSAHTIEIKYSGHNAEKSANIVNTIAKEYLEYDVEIKKESAENIIAFIEDRLKVVYKNLDITEKQLHAFKKENKINIDQYNSTSSPFPYFTDRINQMETELLNIEFELATLERINNQISKNEELNIYEIIATLSGTKSEAIVVSVLDNLQQLVNQREQLLNDVTANNIKIKIINKQIENQKQLLKDFLGTTVERLKHKKADYKIKISEYENKLFDDKNFDELEFNRLERVFSINEGFYHKLIEKKAEYMISQAGYVSLNTILEKATVPRSPDFPIKNKIYPVFILLGLFLGAAYITIRYLLYNKIPSISTIQNYTDAPILGTVPVYRREIPNSQLLVNRKPNSIFTEAFRTIRSNLQFISHGAETKIITISSTVSGEGKTFVAINLAGILSITGKKIILLDLDLRKPRIHLGFNVDNNKGMSTLLIGQHNLKECIQHSELDYFDFIVAGPVPPNPAELASGSQMEDLLTELEDMYDVIIIDTPPVGIVTDALPNLQRANYPIYVMKANTSKRSFIENINYLIEYKNMDNLSVILNGVQLSNTSKYGTYGYGYGYGQGYYTDEEDTSIGKKFTKKIFKIKR